MVSLASFIVTMDRMHRGTDHLWDSTNQPTDYPTNETSLQYACRPMRPIHYSDRGI